MPPRVRLLAGAVALTLLLIGALALRLHPSVYTTSADGIDFLDPDTVRRLARLRHLDQATEYPSVELDDGFPEGTRIQWTLPMDQVIRALDAIAPAVHPKAGRYETGAVLAGPVLGTLAVLVFWLLARRLLGTLPGALAAALYAVSPPVIEGARLGNGDHQSLQHLGAVVALLGCLCVLTGRGGPVLALCAGAAAGGCLWVSAESLALLALLAVAVLAAFVVDAGLIRSERAARVQQFAVACAVVTVTGQMVENRGQLTLAWDRISSYQSAASLAFLVFLILARTLDARCQRPRVMVATAAAVTLLLVVLPFLLVPALRSRLAGQLATAEALTAFAKACVAEYHPLFANGADMARLVFGDTLFVAPLCFVALLVPASAAPLRAALAVASAGLGALALHQVKLCHLFAIAWSLLLPVGGTALLALAGRAFRADQARMRLVRWTAALLALALALWHTLTLTFTAVPESDGLARADRQEVVAAVRDLQFTPRNGVAQQRRAVMAPWELAPYLLYVAQRPVVASSYQRRVDGIRDSFDVLSSTTPEAALTILRRCRARWWIRPGDPSFLFQAHLAFAGRTELGRMVREGGRLRIGLDPSWTGTFWARTGPGGAAVPGLQLVFESRRSATWWSSFAGPPFRVFRVRSPDEPE